MPYLKLSTNAKISNESELLKALSEHIAKETGKPERYVMVELSENNAMLFSGTSDPLAYVECKSIGLSSTQIKSLAASLSRLLNDKLKIAPERIYIEFSACPAENWAWNGSTFG